MKSAPEPTSPTQYLVNDDINQNMMEIGDTFESDSLQTRGLQRRKISHKMNNYDSIDLYRLGSD